LAEQIFVTTEAIAPCPQDRPHRVALSAVGTLQRVLNHDFAASPSCSRPGGVPWSNSPKAKAQTDPNSSKPVQEFRAEAS